MDIIFILLIILCGACSLAAVACNAKLTPIVILCGIMFSIIFLIRSFYLYELKSNTRYRYEQLTSEKTAIDTNNAVKLNNDDMFEIIDANNEYTAKLTFYDTMRMKRFFDRKHKCSVKECVSNYRKFVQNHLNQYAVKKLEIIWPSGSYVMESTNPIKLSEISVH
jgi:hypothetical protein